MLFHSLPFLLFFLVVLALDRALPSWRVRKLMLLAASYLFYAAWNPPFVVLLWISTAVDWWVAKALHREEAPGKRRALLWVSLGVNLGLLGFFKYGTFAATNVGALAGLLGMPFDLTLPDIVLPVGISFYTFQTLSYTLDVYWRRAEPSKSLLDFALYVTFFPQLVAGPIVRATDFLPQAATPRRVPRDRFAFGLFLLTLGMFEKVVLADVLAAPAADAMFGWPHSPVSPIDAWIGTLAFSTQIFCDFAGYSTCAIGTAMALGFEIPDNFRFPYAAVGLRDFWRRWHISLSTWLRDYLYIPLGGSRQGAGRTMVALMTTMLLGGLWHGAAWTFVVWGGLHGLYLVAERWLSRRFGERAWVKSSGGRLFLGAITYLLVLVTWVFFRAPDLPRAGLILLAMFGVIRGTPNVIPTLDAVTALAATALVVATHVVMRRRKGGLEDLVGSLPAPVLILGWAGMLVLLVMAQGGGDAFLYFQF
jgi:alginate O-acetyltransferase complex protein AlgI